jgi:hypothetical protein
VKVNAQETYERRYQMYITLAFVGLRCEPTGNERKGTEREGRVADRGDTSVLRELTTGFSFCASLNGRDLRNVGCVSAIF